MTDKLIFEGDLVLWEVESGFEAINFDVGDRAIGNELAEYFGVARPGELQQLTRRADKPLARVRLTVEVLEVLEGEDDDRA